MAPTSHLRAFQALELAVRTGSLTAAAETLGLTPAAVGQRIKGLEDYLGLDLILRGRSGILPTRGLEAALPHLNAAFRELGTVSDILDLHTAQELHITADTDWADLWLAPRLAKFRADHPNVRFCINGVGDVPLRLGKADCEVWFGAARNHHAEDRLFRDYLLPIGAPDNTNRILGRDSELEGFPLLHIDRPKAYGESFGWPEWVAKFGHRQTAADRGIRYRQVHRALEAVYASAGFLICSLALVQDDLLSGKITLPFPPREGQWTNHSYHIAFSEGAIRRGPVQQFRTWLAAEANKTEAGIDHLLTSSQPVPG